MTFVLDALQDRPIGLYQMDDGSPLQDYSGYNATAAITGSTTQYAPLVHGATYSQLFTSSTTAAFPSTVFKQGFERQSFTLGAWVLPSGAASEQKILSNSGQYDGLVIDGDVLSFVTKYTSTGEARCSYNLQEARRVFALGVHTEGKNSLFVNGVLVSEVAITEEQQADTYASTSANLVCGTTAGSQRIAVNGIAIYAHALTGESATRQWLAGSVLPDAEDAVAFLEGEYIPVSIASDNVFLDQWWETEEDWNQGIFHNTVVEDDELVPQFSEDQSVEGYWTTSFPLEAANVTSIYGVTLNWNGEGATVQVSLDGTSWETVTRGGLVAAVPSGFNPTDKELQVKISFSGGITDDTSYLDNLNIVGLLSDTKPQRAGRTVTYDDAVPGRWHTPLEFHDNWGAEIQTGGNLVISADTLESTPARTLEVWVKRTGTNPTFSMSGTTYQNGVPASSTLVSNAWVLLHIVSGSDVTGSITINGPAQIGHIGIYDRALTASEIASQFEYYSLANQERVNDASVISIAEPTNAANLYAHDWAITGAG